MLTKVLFLSITFLKINQTKFGYFIPVLDYIFISYKQEIVLKFYLKLLTRNVNLKLTDYQLNTNLFQQPFYLKFLNLYFT